MSRPHATSEPPPESVAGLTDAARQRLVTIAADVLGRLPSEQVPPPLRSIARFAAAKRARLGATALTAALDADDEFRDSVAAVVEQGAAQLVEAVRTGSATTASDPIDVAIVAYLVRPARWQDVLATANARWAAERAGAGADTDELARLRGQLAEAKTRAKAQAAQLRAAVADAGERLAAELADAKHTLRQRTVALRTAERDRDRALAAAAEAQQQLAEAVSAHEAELRRLRGRLAEVERAAEAARRGVRADRDLDDARLWLLVETVTEAAAAIRRELALPAPSAHPADLVDAAPPVGGSRRLDDPAAIDRLLGLPTAHLIVDGYNVTKTGYGELALADQRSRLITGLAGLAGQSGAEITVVFDGAARPPAQPRVPRGVRVLFSAPGEIADDLIRRLVAAEPAGRPLLVVTSDQAIVADALRAGAWTVSSAVLLARLGQRDC